LFQIFTIVYAQETNDDGKDENDTVNQDTNDNSNGSTFTVTIPENAAWSESINQRTFAPLL
jgi:hypothetical protein